MLVKKLTERAMINKEAIQGSHKYLEGTLSGTVANPRSRTRGGRSDDDT